MAEAYGPFDSGPGANLFENDYFDGLAPFLQNDGVFGHPNSTDLQVYGNSAGMQVFVRPGAGYVLGSLYRLTSPDLAVPLTVQSSQPRIDRIVLRHDRVANTLRPAVVSGSPSSAPLVPALTRQVGGPIWEVPLAQVNVPSNGVRQSIAPSDVVDDRRFAGMRIRPCVASTMPTSPFPGQPIYRADDNTLRVWSGSAWVIVWQDTTWQRLFTYTAGGTADEWGITPGAPNPSVRKVGATVQITAQISNAGSDIPAGVLSNMQLLSALDGPYRPANPFVFIVPAGVGWGHVMVTSDGRVLLTRTSDGVPNGSNVYLSHSYLA